MALALARFVPIARLDICRGIANQDSWSSGGWNHSKRGAIRLCGFRANSSCREKMQFSARGQRLIIEPAPPKSFLAVLATLQTLEEELPKIEGARASQPWRPL